MRNVEAFLGDSSAARAVISGLQGSLRGRRKRTLLTLLFISWGVGGGVTKSMALTSFYKLGTEAQLNHLSEHHIGSNETELLSRFTKLSIKPPTHISQSTESCIENMYR